MQRNKYLQATKIIDFNSPVISNIISSLDLDGLSQLDKAKKIFYYVRDSIQYSARIKSFAPKNFQSSYTLQQTYSYCIPKALALCALTRAVGVPSRIHLVDFINHRLSTKLIELWGTNVMIGHCYSEIYINDKWVKATPALDIKTCNRHDFIPVEFDGINDGLLKPVDKKGRPHAEYIKDHGTFADLPYEFIMNLFEKTYGKLDEERVKHIFTNQTATFQK